MLGEIFNILELTLKDEQIYLSALALGPQPASVIARKANTKRVDTYNHLNMLCEKGIFKMEMKNNIKHFETRSPEKILEMIKIKRLIIMEAENKLRILLPLLKSGT